MNGGYLRGAMLRAAIAAGNSFFGFLVGMTLLQIRLDPWTAALGGTIAAGVAFFGSLTGSLTSGPPTANAPLPP